MTVREYLEQMDPSWRVRIHTGNLAQWVRPEVALKRVRWYLLDVDVDALDTALKGEGASQFSVELHDRTRPKWRTVLHVSPGPVKRKRRKGHPRDTQKGRLYKAEAVLEWRRDLLTGPELRQFTRKVLRSACWRRLTKGELPMVMLEPTARTMGHATGGYDGSLGSLFKPATIVVPSRCPRALVLHELAHHAAGLKQGHGWPFCKAYLDLVRRFLGADAHAKLRESMRSHGVRYKAPRKRAPLSREQRELLRERLAKARQLKAAKRLA